MSEAIKQTKTKPPVSSTNRSLIPTPHIYNVQEFQAETNNQTEFQHLNGQNYQQAQIQRKHIRTIIHEPVSTCDVDDNKERLEDDDDLLDEVNWSADKYSSHVEINNTLNSPLLDNSEFTNKEINTEHDKNLPPRKSSKSSSPSLANELNQQLSDGHALPVDIRRSMESKFATDFSAVRIHNNQKNQQTADNLSAKAFTYDKHIWLGSNASLNDKHLIAHELTHVLQQSNTSSPLLQRDENKRKLLKIIVYWDEEKYQLEFDSGKPLLIKMQTITGEMASGEYDVTIVNGTITPVEGTFTGGFTSTISQEHRFDVEGVIKMEVIRGKQPTRPTGNQGDKPSTEEELLAAELIEILKAGGKNVPIDFKELLRLYKIIKERVKDPKFVNDDTALDWIRFARFLDANKDKIEGMLSTDAEGKLTQQAIEKIIQEYQSYIALDPDESPQTETKDKESTDEEVVEAYDPKFRKLSKKDRKLLLEYLELMKQMGEPAPPEGKVDFDTIDTSIKVRMAMNLSRNGWPKEIANAAAQAFSDPQFIITFVAIMAVYVGLWLVPEPTLITKVAAGTLTAVLLTQFAYHDIYGLAKAFLDMQDKCAKAKTAAELQLIGEEFARKVGQVGFDIILLIVTWGLGRAVGPKVRRVAADRYVKQSEAKLAEVKQKPGATKEGIPAEGKAKTLLEDTVAEAKAAKGEGAVDPTPTEILDTLNSKLTPEAQQGLKNLRDVATDNGAYNALKGRSAKGIDLNHYLEGRALTPEQTAALQKEIFDAEMQLGRAKLQQEQLRLDSELNEELAKEKAALEKDPALREKILEENRIAREQAESKINSIINEMATTLRIRLHTLGILENPNVKAAVDAIAKNTQAKKAKAGDKTYIDLIGVLGEAIARVELGKRYSSDWYTIEGNLEIVQEIPNATSKTNAATIAGVELGKIRSNAEGTHFYQSLGEIDVMVTMKQAGAKPIPIEIQEVKTGKNDSATKAGKQLTDNVKPGLERIAKGEKDIHLMEKLDKTIVGKDHTQTYDLSDVAAIDLSTRGLPGKKGFTEEIPVPREVLEQLAFDLVQQASPMTGHEPVIAPTPPEEKKEE